MVEAGAGEGVDAEADDAAGDDIARGGGDAGANDDARDRYLLRLVARLFKSGDEFFVLLDRQRAGRNAGQPVAGVDFGAARRRVETDLVRGPAKNRRATAAGRGERKHPDDTHLFVAP